ncbi:MAG: hypothetical protein JSW47_05435 [Phycisphaerales bacterium]|nr:MAG: hypothetical protein JSW47_05435 [Phycisphaerales bacterium]
MCKKLFYSISIVMLLVICAQVQAQVIFSDDFDHAMMDDWSRINYQGWYEQDVLGWPSPGGPWVIGDWDGYQSLPDDTGVSQTLIAHNVINATGIGHWGDPDDPNDPEAWRPGYEGPVLNGILRFSSTNSAWEHDRNTGPFLYMMVAGDFVAEVEIVSYDYWWHHLGGLMARSPNPDGVGANENWTQVCCFPLYGIGNRANDTTMGATSWIGVKGYPPEPYLQLKRVGNAFYYYTSPDGLTWTSLPGLEDGVVRDDLPAELQVGIFHSNFTADWLVNMDFDNFIIETVSELEVAGELLVDVSAADPSAGTETWVNYGTLGDFNFITVEALGLHPDTHDMTPAMPPVVEEFEGVPVVNVTSSTGNLVAYTGPISVPGVEGDGDRSIEAWVADVDDIPSSQVIIAWGHRSEGQSCCFSYGTRNTFGALIHYGDAYDVPWGNNFDAPRDADGNRVPGDQVPTLGTLHHLVYTYEGTTVNLYVDGQLVVTRTLDGPLNTSVGLPINLFLQNRRVDGGFDRNSLPASLLVNSIRVHDGVLTDAQVLNNYEVGPAK